jgi:hypothetical protein
MSPGYRHNPEVAAITAGGRAADERDEFAALHVWHGLPPAEE